MSECDRARELVHGLGGLTASVVAAHTTSSCRRSPNPRSATSAASYYGTPHTHQATLWGLLVEFLTITSRARIGTGPADPAAAADTSSLRNEKFCMFTLHISVREREMNKKNTQVEKCKHCDQLILGKITLMPPDIRF